MAQFGTWQAILNATPKIVKRVRDTIIYLIAGSLGFTPILAPKFNLDAEAFAMWSGLAILFTKGISMLFGVTDAEAAVVQTAQDKLTEMDKEKP